MTRLTSIGLEIHDLGLRMAIVVDDKIEEFPSDQTPWLIFDKLAGTGPLNVSFPGFLSTFGTHPVAFPGGEMATAEAFVETNLRVFKRLLEEKLGCPVGRTVAAVPTYMTSSKREGLLKSIRQAGLHDVHLVDTQLPAGLAFASGQQRSITQLVYSLDHGTCSFALLRSVKGRIKLIDQCIVPTVSGQLCDAIVMDGIQAALRDRNVFMGLRSFGMRHWLEFKRVAQQIREGLARKPSMVIDLNPGLVGDQRPVRLTLSGHGFAALLKPTIAPTIEEMQGLLERNGMGPAEIDAVIAVGDFAQLPAVAGALDEIWRGKVRIAGPGIIAAAAAAQASMADGGLGLSSEQPFDLSPRFTPFSALAQATSAGDAPPTMVTSIEVGEAKPLQAPAHTRADAARGQVAQSTGTVVPTVVAATSLASPPVVTSAGNSGTALAMDLINQGRFQEAAQLLQQLDSAKATGGTPELGLASEAHVLLHEAEDMLLQGGLEQAVQLSHLAYERDRTDPTVFEGMIGIHVRAANCLETEEDYDHSIDLLMCAHSHDQTNVQIQKALAVRHFMHAARLHERNERAAAAKAVQSALRFDPKDEGALRLFEELSNQGT